MKLPPAFPVLLLLAAALSACASDPPCEPPPLAAMELPLALQAEPDDEAERGVLAPGAFSGVYVADARDTLDALLESAPEGVLITRVVENSPGDAAGIVAGDILLEANGELLGWPAQWRALELASAAGEAIRVVYDRAGVEARTTITVVARVRPAARAPAERFREEDRVGVVLRTATEVEARAAGLGPGGGAVVVGLARESPWRVAGVRFGDLITRVDGDDVQHPQVLLTAIRNADSDARLELHVRRAGESTVIEAPVSHRERELTHVSIPLLFSYRKERGRSDTSLFFGLVSRTSTPAAWRMSILWFIRFGGGDADRLVETEG
ncbi:MAG: PDZ domain-containing protein [Planctomycetota bacterium]|nr:PDZ domain-containing protein [Planctomycetota bacterium]